MLKYISKFTRYAPIAPLDRVSGYEPEGRGFESLLACQFTLVTLLGILYTSVLKAVNKIIYHTAEQVQLLHCDNIHFVFRLIVSINALASLRSLTPTQSDVAQLYQ